MSTTRSTPHRNDLEDGLGGLSMFQWADKHWQTFVFPPDDMPVFSGADAAGHGYPGLYFIWGTFDAGGLIYVGRSVNIAARLKAHCKGRRDPSMRFSTVKIEGAIAVPRFLESFEAAYILALRPPNNGKFDQGVWPGVPMMQQAVSSAWAAHRHDDGLYRRSSPLP